MRVGLYGGSFDPVHRGHLLVAEAALEELGLDRLVFIPAFQSPFKPDVKPVEGARRLRWLRLALAGQTRCRVDSMELKRGGASYTIDTVREFGRCHPGAMLFLLIGADQLAQLPLWREAEALATLVEFVVIPRPGAPVVSLPGRYRIHPLRGWFVDISSSEIRRRIRVGLPVHHLLPGEVAQDIAGDSPY